MTFFGAVRFLTIAATLVAPANDAFSQSGSDRAYQIGVCWGSAKRTAEYVAQQPDSLSQRWATKLQRDANHHREIALAFLADAQRSGLDYAASMLIGNKHGTEWGGACIASFFDCSSRAATMKPVDTAWLASCIKEPPACKRLESCEVLP